MSGRTLLRVLSLVGATSITLCFAEAVLRIATPPTLGQQPRDRPGWLVYDPVLGIKNGAGLVWPGFTTNALGFRGTEISPHPAAGEPRVVCLGDSGTFGIWLEEGDEGPQIRADGGYPEALAKLLADRALPGEVINAGVAGYSSSHGLRQLVLDLLPLEPSVIVVRFGLNDHKRGLLRERRVQDPSWPIRDLVYPLLRLRLTRLLLDGQRVLPFRKGPPAGVTVDPDRFRTNLKRIAEVAERAGTRVLFLDYPLRPLALGEHPHFRNVYQPAGELSYAAFHQTHDRYQQVAAEVARVRKVPFIETRPRMVELARNAYSTMDFVHPNNVGAQIIARELLEALLELGWLRNAGGD